MDKGQTNKKNIWDFFSQRFSLDRMASIEMKFTFSISFFDKKEKKIIFKIPLTDQMDFSCRYSFSLIQWWSFQIVFFALYLRWKK